MGRQQTPITAAPRVPPLFLSLCSALVLLADGSAQTTPPAASRQAQDKPAGTSDPGRDRLFLDGVLMTIDNRVITSSQVQDEFESVLSGKRQANPGKALTLRQERQIYQDIKLTFQQDAVRASAALSMPNSTPDQIRSHVDRVLHLEKQDLIKQYGSLVKMKEEMSTMGNSQFMIERQQREKILMHLAQQELHLRLRDRAALMITPNMLRDHYHKVRDARRTTAIVDLGRLAFVIRNPGDPSAELAKARQAGLAWRQGELSTAEIAEKFGGLVLTDQMGITMAKAKLQTPFIATFIGVAKTGQTSEPRVHGGAVVLMKVLRRAAGQKYRWDDPSVQENLRAELLAKELRKIELRNARRDWQKVFKWESPRARQL